ncbi:hypothetical protein EDD16DRAFT_1732131 [Pisolithus croceorrhizus]|nr:hypothetical protein EDD16DRAFT_1732131 [Pisolithus croceorrhizus]
MSGYLSPQTGEPSGITLLEVTKNAHSALARTCVNSNQSAGGLDYFTSARRTQDIVQSLRQSPIWNYTKRDLANLVDFSLSHQDRWCWKTPLHASRCQGLGMEIYIDPSLNGWCQPVRPDIMDYRVKQLRKNDTFLKREKLTDRGRIRQWESLIAAVNRMKNNAPVAPSKKLQLADGNRHVPITILSVDSVILELSVLYLINKVDLVLVDLKVLVLESGGLMCDVPCRRKVITAYGVISAHLFIACPCHRNSRSLQFYITSETWLRHMRDDQVPAMLRSRIIRSGMRAPAGAESNATTTAGATTPQTNATFPNREPPLGEDLVKSSSENARDTATLDASASTTTTPDSLDFLCPRTALVFSWNALQERADVFSTQAVITLSQLGGHPNHTTGYEAIDVLTRQVVEQGKGQLLQKQLGLPNSLMTKPSSSVPPHNVTWMNFRGAIKSLALETITLQEQWKHEAGAVTMKEIEVDRSGDDPTLDPCATGATDSTPGLASFPEFAKTFNSVLASDSATYKRHRATTQRGHSLCYITAKELPSTAMVRDGLRPGHTSVTPKDYLPPATELPRILQLQLGCPYPRSRKQCQGFVRSQFRELARCTSSACMSIVLAQADDDSPTSLSHCVRFTREGHDEVVLKTRWELHQLEQAQRRFVPIEEDDMIDVEAVLSEQVAEETRERKAGKSVLAFSKVQRITKADKSRGVVSTVPRIKPSGMRYP